MVTVANPMAGVTGPRAGRSRGRSRYTIANLASKYPSTPSPLRPAAVGAGTTAPATPAVPASAFQNTGTTSPFPGANPPTGLPNLAALQAAAASTQSLAGLAAMMTQLTQLRALQQPPQQERRDRPDRPNPQNLPTYAFRRNTTPEQNTEIARVLARPFGWDSGRQWSAIYELIRRESSWEETARNPSSGAYGLPQALPATKLPPKGQRGFALPQLRWFFQYIQERYGTPLKALQFHNENNWY